MNYKNENKTLLILDIDETLVFASPDELPLKADFVVFDYYVYKRPYLDEFLNELKDDFLIALWSSASDDYVNEIAAQIIPPDIKPEFVWGRSRCTYRRNIQIDESGYYGDGFMHYHYIKPLKKLKRKGYQLERILIVDDSPHKSKNNYGNAIYPREFNGDMNDNELKFLSQYLKKLKDALNVRQIEKRNWRSK